MRPCFCTIALLAAAAIGAAALPTHADILTFRISGAVTGNSLANLPWANAHAGDSFSLTYTFNTATPDTNVDTAVGIYPLAISSFQLLVGPAFESGAGGGFIIYNNFELVDVYHLDVPLNDQATPLVCNFSMTDNSRAALSSDAIPTTLNLAQWLNSRTLDITPAGGATSNHLFGTATSFEVLPAPNSFAGVVLGLLAACDRRRCK